ncbi:MAG: hypothetical protein A2493_01955 [Candidatus Magasanikbacteria bacterium RIFOXYC12_FULL_33_11]|uniref:DUF559 domain-containing protein n=1 Tax=Candidatus Magasanikbacteria bacterium RIFOXYC12_FULL_33_11 TaxID=1798701 RepID=A0A1F6NMU6_9BACT|nr:MAG: hypothetical protein A2493_01955 [Candidatus Magasanikbacteria bacterium RIFOXYC12_FULL_33_11]
MYSNKSFLKSRRKTLRQDQTKAESLLWSCLRASKIGVRFRRQYSIESFIVDFYCHELKLIIELDGYIHGEEENKKKDIIRQNTLEKLGFKVVRYRNEQIKYELKNVLQDIWNQIHKN